MLEALFNEDYKKANKAYKSAKAKYEKLGKLQADMKNDASSVSGINKWLDYIYEDFAKSIKGGDVRARVKSKLDSMHEPDQDRDGDLNEASDALERERRYLKKKMDAAESQMQSIKSSGGGGGGSW